MVGSASRRSPRVLCRYRGCHPRVRICLLDESVEGIDSANEESQYWLLLVSIPLAILWLAMGFGAFLGLGIVAEKLGVYLGVLLRRLVWALIGLIFWGFWRGRSRAALMLRVILMISFSAIILSATVFMCWWVSSETAPLLVFFLAVLASLNVLFYSRFVRDAALRTI